MLTDPLGETRGSSEWDDLCSQVTTPREGSQLLTLELLRAGQGLFILDFSEFSCVCFIRLTYFSEKAHVSPFRPFSKHGCVFPLRLRPCVLAHTSFLGVLLTM